MNETPTMLDFVKALSDADRLRMIGVLAQHSATVREVASELKLTFRQAFDHLSHLEFVGAVRKTDDHYVLDTKALESLSKNQFSGERETYIPAPELDEKTRKVLKTYLNADGSIRQIPSAADRPVQFRIILEYLVQAFIPGVDYTEKEVNTLIKRFNEDTAGLRRDLVDAGLLGRESNGSRYWCCPATNGNVEERPSTVLYPPAEQRIPNSIAEIDLRLLTDRLVIEQVKDDVLPDEFLETFNSNPDFIENSELFTGKRAYDIADVKMYLQVETRRENSHCLAIRFQDTNKLVGTAALVAPHPNKPFPWIGLLLIDRIWQGRGLGAEAAHAIEDRLAEAGWNEVHLGVMQANPGTRRFWEKQGYAAYEETLDDNKRPVWLMRKSLASSIYPVARDTHE